MYRIWYWAIVGRESDGRFIAAIPDLEGLAAYGRNEKDAVAHVTDLAAERIRSLVESGRQVPHPRSASEIPDTPQTNKIGRAMISVAVGRSAANAAPAAPL